MQIDFQCTELRNGLRIATSRMPHVESVSMGVWVGVGSRYESRRLAGLSHFIEHLVFKGTRKRTARDISYAIEGRGGYFNAFTQEESTCYYARVATEHAWKVFDILADMYLHPRMASNDIDKERDVILEEIMMYRDRPHHIVEEMLADSLWSGHALGRSILGTPGTIQRVSRKEIMDFKSTKYVPGNSVIALAGNLDHDHCVREVQKRLGTVRSRPRPRFSHVSTKTSQRHVAAATRPVEQAHLAMGFRIFGRTDRRRYATKLISVLLGENMSSRLFQVIREKHGLAYSVHSSIQLFDDTGAFYIQAGLDRNSVGKALALVARELERLKEKPVGRQELQRAKDYSTGQIRINLESTSSQMMWIGENLTTYGEFTQPEVVIKRLNAVSAETIQRVATQIFKRRKMSVALVGPDAAEDYEKAAHHELKDLAS